MKQDISDKEPVMALMYQVEVKQHESWHFATCKTLPGLFVGHEKYDTVLKNIPEAISMMIKHECNRDVEVMEAKPTEPTLLGHKTYMVISKAA